MTSQQTINQAKAAAFFEAVEKGNVDNYLKELGGRARLARGDRRTACAGRGPSCGCGPSPSGRRPKPQAQARAAAAVAAPAPAPTPAAAPAAGGSDATSTATADWACIRQHESGGNYCERGGGAYQFELGTWQSVTGLPSPAQDYSAAVQDSAALRLYAERGWEPWTTRYVCGL